MHTYHSAFETAKAILNNKNLNIISVDKNRPWGGFYVIDEAQAAAFAAHFFNDESFSSLNLTGKLSPKLLLVAPGKRLSWQYHHRRAEIWCCLEGKVSVARSFSDEESNQEILLPGDKIKLKQGERHRLIGLEEWGIVAEIWMHTNPEHPSDENDIIRLQDDFNRA